jgi:phosphonate transport system substrate-binding protein
MQIKNTFSLILLLLFSFMIPSICPAWEDFPRSEQGSYLDSAGSDDAEEEYYPSEDEENPFYSDYSDSEDSSEGSFQYGDDEEGAQNEVQQPAASLRPPPLEPGDPINLAEKSIRLGRIPYRSLRELMTQAVPLLRFLQKETGAKEVRLVSNRTNYASVLDSLARGSIDFAWVGPTAYLSRRDKDKLMPVAKARFGGKTAYRGVFIAPAKGRVQGVEDLKGATIGFVDPESASGYVYPVYLLRSLGIDPVRDAKVLFLHNHDNVLRAVLSGKVEAGVCLEETLNSIKDKALLSRIIVLAKTDEIPSDVIVCRQDCPINLREGFLSALLNVNEQTLPKSPTFMAAFDDDFASVESLMQYVDAPMPAPKKSQVKQQKK